jgi:hypothetical protein
VHHEALLIASWPPAPGHVLEAGLQPVSVVVPSVPLKLYLKINCWCFPTTLRGEECSLLVKHDATSSAVCEPSLQLRHAGRDRTGSASTSSCASCEAHRRANHSIDSALSELRTVAKDGSIGGSNSAPDCKGRELHTDDDADDDNDNDDV